MSNSCREQFPVAVSPDDIENVFYDRAFGVVQFELRSGFVVQILRACGRAGSGVKVDEGPMGGYISVRVSPDEFDAVCDGMVSCE